MKKRMLCCLLALVLAVGLLSACGSGKAAVYVQSVAALTGYGSLGGANASSGVVVAQKEIIREVHRYIREDLRLSRLGKTT